ncbi:MAG: hypothetical protein U5Q44_12005 [Dehalococcoidia bacterium]|nr:hypothetical protein [Dehalococcoidia bacterium]
MTLSESGGPAEYRLDSVVCQTASGDPVFNAPIAPVPVVPVPLTFTMPAEDVTCTFTNVYDPNILTLQSRRSIAAATRARHRRTDEWTLSGQSAPVSTSSGSSGVCGHVAPGTLVDH